MSFLLLSVCIAKCPYVPVDANLMQVVPGVGGQELPPGRLWADGLAGAGSRGNRSILELVTSGAILSLAVCTGLFPLGKGLEEGGHVCVSVVSLCKRCRAPQRVWPGV